MNKITGIYMIGNDVNNKVYIGQSKDILTRWYAHKSKGRATSKPFNSEYYSELHSDMREFGLEHFFIEIIEECEENVLDEKEKYWIRIFNSYEEGYNGNLGGNFGNVSLCGELNGRALLTEEDVICIREMYNDHIPFRDVFPLFEDKISRRGLQKVWYFETWKHILPEYNTPENKKWHSTKAKSLSSEQAKTNGFKGVRRNFTAEQVLEARDLYKKGMTPTEIKEKLGLHGSTSSVQQMLSGRQYKNITKS